MEISLDDLKRMLPETETTQETDQYYLTVAKYLDKLSRTMHAFPEITEEMRKAMVLALVSYYQDIVADAGLWRSFVLMCRKLYGRPVPFYEESEDYVDSELNLIDVQFIIWYSLESELGFSGLVSPYDADLLRFARQACKLFDYLYADAPKPENFRPLAEVDLNDREQIRDIFRISGWLFWNSYFMRPVSKHVYEPDVAAEEELTIDETLTDADRLQTTFRQPTGPLALFVDEWLRMIVENRYPKERQKAGGKTHIYYEAMTKATGGRPIAFCRTYDELERFLSDRLGWGKSEDGHLPSLKDFRNFVLFANPEKGLIVAHDIAAYICHPDNPLYDKDAAHKNAHRLVMEQAVCPIDLVKYLMENGYLPDAEYPVGDRRREIMRDNWDFLARLYLMNFYRAD